MVLSRGGTVDIRCVDEGETSMGHIHAGPRLPNFYLQPDTLTLCVSFEGLHRAAERGVTDTVVQMHLESVASASMVVEFKNPNGRYEKIVFDLLTPQPECALHIPPHELRIRKVENTAELKGTVDKMKLKGFSEMYVLMSKVGLMLMADGGYTHTISEKAVFRPWQSEGVVHGEVEIRPESFEFGNRFSVNILLSFLSKAINMHKFVCVGATNNTAASILYFQFALVGGRGHITFFICPSKPATHEEMHTVLPVPVHIYHAFKNIQQQATRFAIPDLREYDSMHAENKRRVSAGPLQKRAKRKKQVELPFTPHVP